MLINIDEVKVNDRIRKDFGDIEELANDIKKNGLINPPTVTPEYELIAGERRLRACKHLGFQQIEVRIVSVRDEEHQLNMEISENENRKEFTYSERMDWSKRLGRIESIKARERQGKRTDLTSGKTLSDVRADDVVAEKSGFGSREQYRKAKFIDEHADEETIKKLDEEKISIHRAWTETKEKLEQAEKRAKQAESQAETERKERERLELENEELANVEPEIIEKEVIKEIIPEHVNAELEQLERVVESQRLAFDEAKRELESYRLRDANSYDEEEARKEIQKLNDEADKSVLRFKIKVDRFIEEVAITSFMEGAIASSSDPTRKKLQDSVDYLKSFTKKMETALKGRVE